ncbi:MAG: YfhO family protein [Lachnospiraceae bacterium]|nr:YfhO family protein [Lachnospiraceae bacterium]
MKKWFQEQEKYITFFAFLAIMLAACSPLITKLCINGHDLEYHLLRIESLKEGILAGRPFARVNLLYFGGAGYASSLFYPDFLLYLPAILRALGVGINACYHIFVAVVIFLTGLSTMWCTKRMTGSAYAGITAAALLTLSPYYLGDIYVRSAVGEYTAFIFLPFVILGIYNVLYEEADRSWTLGLGYGGVLLCHTNTFLFCLLFGLVAFLVKWKVFKNLSVLRKLFVTIVVTAGLTMFYWAPLLEMMLTTPLYVNDAWIGLEQTAKPFYEIFSPAFPGLGVLLFCLALFRILIRKNAQNRELVDYADWLLFGGCVFSFLATDLLPWKRLNAVLSFVQFPWRFFVLATAMLAVADAILIAQFVKASLEPLMQGGKKLVMVLVLMFSIAGGLGFLSSAGITYYDYSDDYYSHKPFTANVIAGEWLPKTVENRETLIEDSEHLYTDNGEELPFVRGKGSVEATIDKFYNYADVPLIYYRGYRAYVGGDRVNVSAGRNGLCRVELNGRTGTMTVKYAGTFLQHFSSISSFLVLVLLIVLTQYKKNKQKKEEKS